MVFTPNASSKLRTDFLQLETDQLAENWVCLRTQTDGDLCDMLVHRANCWAAVIHDSARTSIEFTPEQSPITMSRFVCWRDLAFNAREQDANIPGKMMARSMIAMCMVC